MIRKYLFRFFSSKITFFLATTIFILALNLTPLVSFIRHAPPGRTFALIHNNTQDYFFYQALMNQGASGQYLTTDPYTSEPHRPSIIFSFFLWFGKLSQFLGLPFAITYHLIRIIVSIFFLFSVYCLLFSVNLPYPRLAFFFFLFAAPLMHKINEGGKIVSVPFMNWWTGMDPIRRVAYLPHHMIGALLLVISIIFLIKYIKTPKSKYLLLLILISTALSFIHPPSLLIILLFLPATIIIYLITQFISKKTRAIHFPNYLISQLFNYPFIGLFVYWVIGLFLLILMVSQTNQGFPWSQYIDWEKRLQFPLDREIIGALGILFPLSLIGAVKAIWSRRFDYILIACWLFVPLLLIPVAPKFNLSNIRLIQGVPYLSLAILAIIGIQTIEENISKYIISAFSKSNLKYQISKTSSKLKVFNFKLGFDLYALNFALNPKILNNFLLFVFIIVFILISYPTLNWSLRDQIREYTPIFGNVYFDNRLNNAFAFINQNYPSKTVTLSTFYTGNYLPAFTHTVSFIGHFGYTYNIDQKDKQAMKFFKNIMTDQEAKDLIVNNKITLVIQGPEEKPIYPKYLYPNILKPVYDKDEMTIYTLNNK